jgi:diguanylate cyclase (GGDEF)-like protein
LSWLQLNGEAAEEGVLSGRISGVLFAMGGITFATTLLLPGLPDVQPGWVLALSGASLVWGLLGFWAIDWRRRRPWLMHGSIVAACLMIAGGTSATGGASSLAWIYLFFVVVFSAYFYTPQLTALYVGLVIVVQALPLLYDSRAAAGDSVAQLVIAGSAYVTLALAIASGKALTDRLRVRAEELAAEQSALRRVATAVVDGLAPAEIYELVSGETARLLSAAGAAVLRLQDDRRLVVVGSWARLPEGRYPAGRTVPVRPGSDMDQAIATGAPVRVEVHREGGTFDSLGYTSSIVAPIKVAGRTWGLMVVATDQPGTLTADHERHLDEIVDLLATSIASLEDRAKLSAQASTDPLTGLANHRELHERLRSEVARARRHGQPLSVAVLDIDHFKQLNDIAGHATGDRLLVAVADSLREVCRTEDTLGRVGGDEFAWILPGSSREQAFAAVERVRKRVATSVQEQFRVTISAGICDMLLTDDPGQLIRFADGALYWSKAHGRDQCWIYDPDVVDELSAQERAERLARSQALIGLRALARAIDAKDPATREHSERVSLLVGRLAAVSGWAPEQALKLSEAALVHDVGKIGVPDQTLRKVTPLTSEERTQIRGHAELAAQIVEGVLSPEQVDWIRTHHERPDGTGYPRGLREPEIPEGALLLALADAWDVMTVSRPYSLPKSTDEALAECTGLVGRQFSRAAVDALLELHRDGELTSQRPHTALLRA